MQNVNSQIEMPKLLNIEIKPYGFGFKIWIRGVMLKRLFLTRAQAEAYLPDLHNYFGDGCVMVLKGAT